MLYIILAASSPPDYSGAFLRGVSQALWALGPVLLLILGLMVAFNIFTRRWSRRGRAFRDVRERNNGRRGSQRR